MIVPVLPPETSGSQPEMCCNVLCWRFLSLGKTSVVCAGPACRGRLRCMLVCRSCVAALRSGSLFSGRPVPADVHGMAVQSTCEKSCL